MSSGLIYAVIVALWAVVLVPMWLRRHDEVTESRSVDRFQGAMRTLSRRESGAGDRREVLVPRRRATRSVPDGAAEQLSAAAVAAERRRRTSLVLGALTLLLLVLAKVHVLPLWTAVLPLLLLLAFLGQATMSARRARAHDLAVRRARAADVRRERVEAARLAMPMPQAMTEQGYQAAAARRAALATAAARTVPVPVPVPAPVAAPMPAAASAAALVGMSEEFFDAQAEPVWDPVPVPVPTYVSAPKAPRSVRVIDLTKPGHWTSGHLDPEEAAAYAEQAAEHAEARRAADPDGIVTGEVLIQRRAVGD